jgi:cytochrome c oxidase subunit 2
MKHLVAVGVLVLVVGVGLAYLLTQLPLLPVEASAQAVPIDRLFELHFQVIAFLFALIIVFLVYSVVVFRRKPGDMSDGDHFEGNTALEIVWTIVPLGIVLLFAYLGANTLAETRTVDPQAMVVEVTASQWSWSFHYPDGDVTSAELRLPVDKQVLLKLTSTDVIHSFWVPEFRVKQDALPGVRLVKELRVTPTMITPPNVSWKVRCAELCGGSGKIGHATMEAPVYVLSQADFDAWLASQSGAGLTPAERGKKIYDTKCKPCHSIDGSTGVGPTWKGVYGSQVALEGGTTVTADDAYVLESILQPQAKIVQGFTTVQMPNFGLSEAQAKDILEYFKTLK